MDLNLAQTNLQLYVQLRRAGASQAEIHAMQKDYETACMLFGTLCRSTGRPFLCHAVGTASAALHEGAPFIDVRAALLHAAYKHGRFPDGKKKSTPGHTAWLTNRVGPELADLLAIYSVFPFTPEVVRGYIASDSKPDDLTLRLILLKLANDVDDSHCFGAALGHKARYQDPTWLTLRQELSEKLGFAYSAKAFAQALKECSDANWLDTQTEFARVGYSRSIVSQAFRKITGKDR
jgi:hypothetical protein